MVRLGAILVIIAVLMLVVYPLYFLYFAGTPDENVFKAAITIGLIGGVLIVISTLKDRYNEFKEDKINDDYRKY